jgi:hypothetical protein
MDRASLYRRLRADYIAALKDDMEALERQWIRREKAHGPLFFLRAPKPIPFGQLRAERILARARALGFRGIDL